MKPLKDNNASGYKGHKNTNEIKVFSGYELPNYYNVPEHQQFIDCAHKSQKITTAIYMITDLVPNDDPLVQQLRTHAVEVMNTLHLLTTLPQAQRVQVLSEASTFIYGLSSYLHVLHHTAKVSSMNYTLITNELSALQDHLNLLLTKNLPYDRKQRSSQVVNEFSFSEDFFRTSSESGDTPSTIKDTPRPSSVSVKDSNKRSEKSVKDTSSDSIKDTSQLRTTKRETDNHASPQATTEKKEKRSTASTSKGHSSKKTNAAKELRHENILKILKQKKDAQIGDITSLITDCGSKTIQRDLIELVNQGLVSKEGDRRWSVYNLAY